MGLGYEWAVDVGAVKSDNPIYNSDEPAGIWSRDTNFVRGLQDLKKINAYNSFVSFVAKYNTSEFKDVIYGKGIPDVKLTDQDYISGIINPETGLKELGSGLVNIDPKFLDLSGDTTTDNEMIEALGFAFQDYEKRAILHDRNLKDKYLGVNRAVSIDKTFNPAKFVGWLEDSPQMYFDVLAAAEETQVDPVAVYLATMQEGMAERIDAHEYRNDDRFDMYMDIGLEAVSVEEQHMLDRNILKRPIDWYSQDTNKTGTSNEDGMGYISSETYADQTWRGTAGLYVLNKGYLQHQIGEDGAPGFKDLGIDFDSLPDATQFFWIYSAINAGHSDAKHLLNAYGAEPWKNEEFLERLSPTKLTLASDHRYEDAQMDQWGNMYAETYFASGWAKRMWGEREIQEYEHPKEYSGFHEWMFNSLRVTMAYENMQTLSPWEDTDIDVDKKVFNLLK